MCHVRRRSGSTELRWRWSPNTLASTSMSYRQTCAQVSENACIMGIFYHVWRLMCVSFAPSVQISANKILTRWCPANIMRYFLYICIAIDDGSCREYFNIVAINCRCQVKNSPISQMKRRYRCSSCSPRTLNCNFSTVSSVGLIYVLQWSGKGIRFHRISTALALLVLPHLMWPVLL